MCIVVYETDGLDKKKGKIYYESQVSRHITVQPVSLNMKDKSDK